MSEARSRAFVAMALGSLCAALLLGLQGPARANVIVDQSFLSSKSLARGVTPIGVGGGLPATTFLDQAGRPFSFAQLRGQGIVIAFIYTRCEDANECPLISAHYRQLQARFAGQRVHLVEVTLDPVYDRPSVLAKYGKMFGEDPRRWTLVTGDPATVLRFAQSLGITAIADPRSGLIHNERTVLVGPDGRVRMFVDEAAWDSGEIVAAMRTVMNLKANVFERFNLWLSAQAVSVCGNGVASVPGFMDLVIVIAIVGALGWIFARLARGLFGGAAGR